jgi:hypothetical protein
VGNFPANFEKDSTDTFALAQASIGAGWKITPEKFYVGGVRFAQANRDPKGSLDLRVDIAGYSSELGLTSWGPRKGDKPAGSPGGPTIVPILDAKGAFHEEKIGNMPTAHFIIEDAYWVYKATKGGVEEYFAIKMNERARTITHSAYDEEYSKAIEALQKKYPGAVFGRSYEEVNEQATLRTKKELETFKDQLGALRGYLKIGDKKVMETDYSGKKLTILDPKF